MFVDSQKGVRKRVSLIGAIGKDGIHHFEAYDTANWPNFEKFLRNLHKKFGKVLIYMDNAPYHGKARLREMTKETKGEMQFRFTLPYTPELNPIKTRWTPVKGGLVDICNVYCQAGDQQRKQGHTAGSNTNCETPRLLPCIKPITHSNKIS